MLRAFPPTAMRALLLLLPYVVSAVVVVCLGVVAAALSLLTSPAQ